MNFKIYHLSAYSLFFFFPALARGGGGDRGRRWAKTNLTLTQGRNILCLYAKRCPLFRSSIAPPFIAPTLMIFREALGGAKIVEHLA